MNTLNYIINKYSIDTNAPSPIFIPNTKRSDLVKLFSELGFKTGAEVGVERGVFSEEICLNIPGVKLYCVDYWKVDGECPDYNSQRQLDRYYNQAKVRLAPYNCKIIKKSSLDAVQNFSPKSLDFVHIDANHSFDFVTNDIAHWSKIVKPGGIVSGHDYVAQNISHSVKYDVIEATKAYTNGHQIQPWFVFSGERSASWFWVKGQKNG